MAVETAEKNPAGRATAASETAAGETPMVADPAGDEARWAAVLARDPAADETFWYSVATTGVYCRPSCPSRRPRRQHVAFHPSRAAAEAAGFRPCRRCRPDAPAHRDRRAAAVAAACRRIAEAEEPPALGELAAAAGLSPYHFHRVFKAVTGVTPKAYAMAHRAGRVRADLDRGTAVTAALYDAGFNASSRFYEQAPGMLGMTPTAYRDGGRGETIRFAVGDCWLGSILVAATATGVCAIEFGDDPEHLVRALQDRFPKADLRGGDATFEATVATVIGFVDTPTAELALPLDVRGTVFQEKVWRALRAIPPGTTISYAELARRVGAPGAARAVGAACGANPVAVAIPCHRVVRTDGDLSGYRWGLDRKRRLIAREAGAGS